MMPRNYSPRQRPNIPPHFYYGPMPRGQQQPVNPMMGFPPQRQMRQSGGGGGGLLAKLLGKGKQQAARGPFGGLGVQNAQQGGNLLRSIANPASLNGFLTNTQKVLSTAQQVGPVIQQFQQYGPIIKNLPAMWRLYRGLKDAPDHSDGTEETTADPDTETNSFHTEQDQEPVEQEPAQERTTPMRRSPAPSLPKLYI